MAYDGKAPCKGCKDRRVSPEPPYSCHSRCEKYLAWKAEKDAIAAEIRERREQELRIKEHIYHNLEGTKKGKCKCTRYLYRKKRVRYSRNK